MDRNPYAPPDAAIDDLTPIGFKRRRVLMMILFFILTLGLYVSVWFLRRRAALNRLDSPKKVQLWPFLMYVAYFVAEFSAGFMTEFAQDQRIGHDLTMFAAGLRLLTSIVIIVQCFVVRT